MSTRRTISLHGIQVPLKSRMPDEDLDRALDLVRERMDQVAETAAVREPARLALMAALNLAGEYLLVERRAEELQTGALKLLSERIATHLDQMEDAPELPAGAP